jgi:hypothetical protein
MLEPRRTTPRRTAVKFAIVALSNDSRASLRLWIERDVAGDGTCTVSAPAVTTWLDVVRAAVVVVNAADRAWLRS